MSRHEISDELVQYPELPPYLQEPLDRIFDPEKREPDSVTVIDTPYGPAAAIRPVRPDYDTEKVMTIHRGHSGVVTVINHITINAEGLTPWISTGCPGYCHNTIIRAHGIEQGGIDPMQRVHAPLEQHTDGSFSQYIQKQAVEQITTFLEARPEQDALAPGNMHNQAQRLVLNTAINRHYMGPAIASIVHGWLHDQLGGPAPEYRERMDRWRGIRAPE